LDSNLPHDKARTELKLFRRLLLVLSVATAVVGILRFGGSGKQRVTTKQGGWRSYEPTK